jgi:flagellar biosynthesis/type III secretory pathway protein FliH
MANADYTIYSDRPIERVEVIEDSSYAGSGMPGNGAESAAAEINRLCQVLRQMAEDINIFYEKNISEHREAIARLSVEIARRILVKNINERDYKIEDIVKEALKSVPVRKNIVICVNPQDYTQFQKLRTEGSENILEGIELVSDATIGPAECIIKTPKGTIRSLIDEHLERIGQAFAGSG